MELGAELQGTGEVDIGTLLSHLRVLTTTDGDVGDDSTGTFDVGGGGDSCGRLSWDQTVNGSLTIGKSSCL